MIGHNNPPVVLELTRDEAEFLVKTCEANLEFALNILMDSHGSEHGELSMSTTS